MRTLLLLAPERTTAGLAARLDLPMLAFTVLVAAGASLLFGLAPAWHASGRPPVDALKAGGRSSGGSTRQGLRSLLVVSETALALVLLVGAGLFLRSLANMQEIHPGFDAQGVMTAGVSLPEAVYKEPAQRASFFRTVLERLAATPGVGAVAAATPLPFSGNNPSASFSIEGRQPGPGDPGPHGDVKYVTPGYFDALKIPLEAGRLFTDQDRDGALRVVIVDENLARQYWPGESPVGKRLRRGGPTAPWWTIVGVVGHVKHASLAADVGKGASYYPLFQQPLMGASIVARTAGDPAALASAIRTAVREADPAQPVQRLSSLDELVASSLDAPRFVMRLLAFFAAVSLFMAALGLFGVISYSVTQRTQELGVRMALGAPRTSVLRMVVGQGFRLAAAGVVIGVLAAVAASRLLGSQLYEVSVFDPPTFGATVGILLGAALLASYFPARRATRVDPLLALRQE